MSEQARVHITGAAGAGVSTLGVALAKNLELAYFDADNYFWLPTDPPYQLKRDVTDRTELLSHDLRN